VISPLLHEWVLAHAEHMPDAPAIASPRFRLSYGVLADRIRVLAGHLAQAGIGPGDRVLVGLPNSAAAVVAGLAIQMRGATSVEVSRDWSPAVLGDVVARSQVRAAFVSGRDAPAWGQAFGRRRMASVWAVHPGPLPPELIQALGVSNAGLMFEDGRLDPDLGRPPEAPALDIQLDSPALILYTSGSTGTSQGVIQTFRNIDANSRSIVEYLELTSDDRASLTLPLYYCYGRSVLQTHILVGGSVFLDNRMAYPRVVVEAIGAEGCTGFAGVPLTFEMIRRQVDVASIALPRLRYLTQAGGAMSSDTIGWARAAFSPAQLFVMYGQTEATARLSYLPPERAVDKPDSIGLPIRGVELKVVDADGCDLPPGEMGELVARGDNVTLGYLDEPEETARILRAGWLWTGDLACRDDDGFFYLKGRTREILKIGGHRVSPIEIEQAIARHPDVEDVAVTGLADDLLGEVPVAWVVIRSGTTTGPDELRRFCLDELPPYQVPVSFVLLDALPRNEAGKLLRAELATRHLGDELLRPGRSAQD
jgi:long-chain acyl-CoA synthetase